MFILTAVILDFKFTEMNFQQYLEHFERILHSPKPESPYDSPDYFNYTKLNWSRMNRWMKHGELTNQLKEVISQNKIGQEWIVITEPWCGDAAHVVPFIELTARALGIQVHYEMRDTDPHRINDYLTNGGKAIPKLVIKDGLGKDLISWGPRPEACQKIYEVLKNTNASFEEVKIALQNWYNADGGQEIMQEITELLLKINA